MAIANVVNLFDPDLVVLTGGLVEAGPLLIEPLRTTVRAYQVDSREATVPVKVSELGRLSGAMGAAMTVLSHFFEAGALSASAVRMGGAVGRENGRLGAQAGR